MMQKILKVIRIIAILISSLIIIFMIISYSIFRDALVPLKLGGYLLTYEYANYDINRKNDILEREKKEDNNKAIKKYIINAYGEVVSKVVEVEYIGRRRGWHADSEYILHFPFANDKTIYVESETQKIFSRDFSFAIDTKFQHLYSEWVKKQVGIEDENVEFGFAGNYDTPYIEFNKITSLSDDCREVFENTHNLYLDTIIVNNNEINENNYIEYFNNIKDEIYNKCYRITGKPKRPHSLFVYINDYRLIYNFPEEVIASISKKNENPKDYGGSIWSSIKIK